MNTPVPLKNLKNTCYINCSLQIFSVCQSYLKRLQLFSESSLDPHDDSKNKDFIFEFFSILQVLSSQKSDPVSPVSFINLSHKTFKFSYQSQEDIIEYLEKLINLLVTEIPETDSFFKGNLTTRLTCRSCKKTRYSKQIFYSLGIPIPQSRKGCSSEYFCKNSKKTVGLSLENCIQDFFYKENYENLDCDFCGEESSHMIENIFEGAGEYLVLFLKRYKNQWFFKKDYSYIELPQFIDIEISADRTTQRFKLMAVVEHTDFFFFGGHYTCYVNRGMSWYYLNDDKVKRCTWQQVSKAQAYVMLFRRCQNDQKLNKSILFY